MILVTGLICSLALMFLTSFVYADLTYCEVSGAVASGYLRA